MITRNRRWTALALAAMLTVSGAACGSDSDDDDTDATTTTAATEAPDTEGDEGEMDEGDEGDEAEGGEAAIAPLADIDPCSLITDVDIESVLGDEVVTPTAESTTALPAPNVSSEVDPTEAIGCGAFSAEVMDAGIMVRVFRFPSADDAAAAAESLTNGEELDSQADTAMISRFDMPAGFSYVATGSLGDVLVVVQAQSVPDLTDPATQTSTLNYVFTQLQSA